MAVFLSFGRNALGSVVSVQEQSGTSPYSLPCVLTPASTVALRCMRFEEHLYAVAEVDLQTEEIVFTTSNDKRMETFPEIVNNLSSAGVKPILVTNAGICGTDNRPLGLLISPKGKLHNVSTAAGSGNFSWDSAVFQVSDDGTASIVPARSWQDNPHTIAATQSGPQLASSGKINESFQPQSKWSFRRRSYTRNCPSKGRSCDSGRGRPAPSPARQASSSPAAPSLMRKIERAIRGIIPTTTRSISLSSRASKLATILALFWPVAPYAGICFPADPYRYGAFDLPEDGRSTITVGLEFDPHRPYQSFLF